MPGTQCNNHMISRTLQLGLLVFAGVTVLFIGSTMRELHGTPTFYASMVKEIVDNGDPLYIFRGADAYLLKPPLVLWLSAASCKVFGLTHFGATFVPRLAGLSIILLCYLIVRRLFDAPTGWIAAIVLATNSTFVQFSTTLRMDSMLMAGTLLAITGWLYRDRPWAAGAIFSGITIAILAKGPLGMAPVVLIGAHAALSRVSPFRVLDWRWSGLLVAAVLWYGYVFSVHGLRPLSELGTDAMRASSSISLDLWGSAFQEYVMRPLRRYWPWLPFMLAGIGVAARRLLRSDGDPTARATHAWLLLWIGIVVFFAVAKPDHDIRYLYPAIPPLAALSAVVILPLLGGRVPVWLSCGVAVTCVCAWFLVSPLGWGQAGGVDQIEKIREQLRLSPEYTRPVVLGGYPVSPGAPRRQNSERDWVYFYLGVVPRIIPWHEINKSDLQSLPYVLTMRSAGHGKRLAELGFGIEATTKEMVMAKPR